MLRCLHLADMHLGWVPKFLGTRCEERRRERDSLLERVVDWALRKQNDIHLVVIAGDLFETHKPDPRLVEGVLSQLSRLDRAGILVVTTPGNHDEITYHDSVYRQFSSRWPGILVHSPMPIEVGSTVVHGVSCHFYSLAYTGGLTVTHPPISEFPRTDEPGIHLGIFHGAIDWDTGDRSLPISRQALETAGYQYVALGHIHKHSVIKGRHLTAAYCGAVESKGFSDIGAGHLTVVSIDGNDGTVVIDKPEFNVREHVIREVDITGYVSAEELIQHLSALGNPEGVVQIRLTGAASFVVDVDLLEQRLENRFYFLEIRDETAFASRELIDRWAAEPTIRGLFVSRLLNRIELCNSEEECMILRQALMAGISAFQKAYGESR